MDGTGGCVPHLQQLALRTVPTGASDAVRARGSVRLAKRDDLRATAIVSGWPIGMLPWEWNELVGKWINIASGAGSKQREIRGGSSSWGRSMHMDACPCLPAQGARGQRPAGTDCRLRMAEYLALA